jgi:uncharacterized Zn-binding protein involved in type VI secretion
MGQPAATITHMHVCPMVAPAPCPHVGGPILPPGVPTVLVGGLPAAPAPGNMIVCCCVPDTTAKGSATVLVGKRMWARLGDTTSHGGTIVQGCPTVLVGG